MPLLEVKKLLRTAFDACDSRKAEDIRILALDPTESSLTDYFLICSGTNERQNVAISDEIEFRLKNEYGTLPNSVEGRRQGEWVLMDYVDFVVHIFMPEKRAYYGLEQLRKSATTLSLAELDDEIKAALKTVRQKSPVKSRTITAENLVPSTSESVQTAAAKKGARKTAVKKTAAAIKTPRVTTKKRRQMEAPKRAHKRSVENPAI